MALLRWFRVSMDLTRPLRFEELQSVLRWLSECDVVHAIELGQKFRTHNYFAQVRAPVDPSAARFLHRFPAFRSIHGMLQEITQTGNQRPERVIWNKGIRGEGQVRTLESPRVCCQPTVCFCQIVGVADSGLDWNHCFFADPKFSGPNRDARKVLSYTVGAATSRPPLTSCSCSCCGRCCPEPRLETLATVTAHTWSVVCANDVVRLQALQLGCRRGRSVSLQVGSIAGDAGWLREHGGDRSNAVPDIMVQFGGMAPGAKVSLASGYFVAGVVGSGSTPRSFFNH